MFDGKFEEDMTNTGSAVGVIPLSLAMQQFAAGVSFYNALCRMNPFLAPFVPKG